MMRNGSLDLCRVAIFYTRNEDLLTLLLLLYLVTYIDNRNMFTREDSRTRLVPQCCRSLIFATLWRPLGPRKWEKKPPLPGEGGYCKMFANDIKSKLFESSSEIELYRSTGVEGSFAVAAERYPWRDPAGTGLAPV